MALLQGQGVSADPQQARLWLQRAAQEGLGEAQAVLGEAQAVLARLGPGPDNLAHAR